MVSFQNKTSCQFLALCLISVAVSAKQIPLEDISPKTVMISELFRHGARYTLFNLFNETKIEENNGQLTSTGMREHYILGKAVRKSYPQLFSDVYDHRQFDIVSTHLYRTVESAQSHFMGMYDLMSGEQLSVNNDELLNPPFNKNQHDKVVIKDTPFAQNGGFRPVPIFALDLESDMLLMGGFETVCPNAQKLTQKEIDQYTPEFDKASKPLSDDLIKLGLDPIAMFGHDSFSGNEIAQIYDYAKAHLYMYGKHKEPITAEIYDRMELVFSVDFFGVQKNSDVSKLITHNLALKIIETFKKKMDDPSSKLTYKAFSAHDSTIAPWMVNIGMNSFECLLKELQSGVRDPKCHHSIEYASNIIWELNTVQDPNNNKKTDYLIKMLYNGNLMYACQDAFEKGYLKAEPKYEGYCTFDEFVEVSKHMFEVGDKYNEICKGGQFEKPTLAKFKFLKKSM